MYILKKIQVAKLNRKQAPPPKNIIDRVVYVRCICTSESIINWERKKKKKRGRNNINNLKKQDVTRTKDIMIPQQERKESKNESGAINVLHTKYDCGSSVYSLLLCVKNVCIRGNIYINRYIYIWKKILCGLPENVRAYLHPWVPKSRWDLSLFS